MEQKHQEEQKHHEEEKQLSNAGGIGLFFRFLIDLCIVLPLYLFTLLPMTIIWHLVAKLFGCLTSPCRRRAKADEGNRYDLLLMNSTVEKRTFEQKDYDLVLFGATGFTGKLAAQYVAKQYGTSIKWAIAGRSKGKLEKVKELVLKVNSELTELPIIIADSNNLDQLIEMVNNTRVICSSVGPFARYGSALVATCAYFGTNYCDITGEVHWVRQMIERYDNIAHKNNAILISCCGNDCIPWDLMTFKLSQFLGQRQNEELVNVKFFDEILTMPSGGTLETVFESLKAKKSKKKRSELGFDPLFKLVGKNVKSTNKTRLNSQKILGKNSVHKSWVTLFVMAMVNGQIVRRSNALLGYSSKLTYYEAQVHKGFMNGFHAFLVNQVIFGTALFFPPVAWLLRKFVLPSPGQGPSKEQSKGYFLRVHGYGTGSKGTKVKATLYYPNDPGYVDTARMLVETGLSMSLEKLECSGGYHTTASAGGDVLLRRLIKTGCTFHMEEISSGNKKDK